MPGATERTRSAEVAGSMQYSLSYHCLPCSGTCAFAPAEVRMQVSADPFHDTAALRIVNRRPVPGNGANRTSRNVFSRMGIVAVFCEYTAASDPTFNSE